MLSIRSFARSAPRIVPRLASSTVRQPAARQVFLSHSAWRPARTQYSAAFSTTAIRASKAAEGDEELVAKLESEIEMENEMKEEGGVPTSIKDYLENGPFELQDIPGREDVTLTRQFGDETITVMFSIADLNAIDPEADYQDRALGDEEDLDNINQGNEKGFKVAPEDSDQEPSFPARVNVVVEKPGKGALAVEALAQDGMVIIENAYFYTDASLAHAKTADKLHARQDLYVGPPFSNLDEDLQVLLERYLEERGINTALAIFVPDYIDMKEQKEYLNWLSNVKNFIEA
ncbi:hypothetical protein OIDMADRAFT_163100 [Oidiodendron maius Zn]|uniref:Mitochondrial glyco protein n=1 Tax=Oidiodendron maius (strain Zn) TaxID=913774 RepID=A0A0C3DGB6_OIDMZ|nr:hypothetical protein OIDMADRAFT_163100 [Oidiodendron maius Zn]